MKINEKIPALIKTRIKEGFCWSRLACVVCRTTKRPIVGLVAQQFLWNIFLEMLCWVFSGNFFQSSSERQLVDDVQQRANIFKTLIRLHFSDIYFSSAERLHKYVNTRRPPRRRMRGEYVRWISRLSSASVSTWANYPLICCCWINSQFFHHIVCAAVVIHTSDVNGRERSTMSISSVHRLMSANVVFPIELWVDFSLSWVLCLSTSFWPCSFTWE